MKRVHLAGGYSADHPVIRVFWRVVEGFSDEEKRKLLKFVTSCSRPPLLGFKVPLCAFAESLVTEKGSRVHGSMAGALPRDPSAPWPGCAGSMAAVLHPPVASGAACLLVCPFRVLPCSHGTCWWDGVHWTVCAVAEPTSTWVCCAVGRHLPGLTCVPTCVFPVRGTGANSGESVCGDKGSRSTWFLVVPCDALVTWPVCASGLWKGAGSGQRRMTLLPVFSVCTLPLLCSV